MKNQKIAFVIAFRGFKDEECFIPLEILEASGIKVEVASNKKGLAIGAEGGELAVDYATDELEMDNHQGLFFVGGPGALRHLDNEKSYRLARTAVEKDKLLGAICISPVILAKAGVLKDKKATVWHSSVNKKPVHILKENGAQFVDRNVVKDRNIITANGPAAAQDFGKKILDSLK